MWVTVKTPEGKIQDTEVRQDSGIMIGDVLADGSVVVDVPFIEEFSDGEEPGYTVYQDEDDDI